MHKTKQPRDSLTDNTKSLWNCTIHHWFLKMIETMVNKPFHLSKAIEHRRIQVCYSTRSQYEILHATSYHPIKKLPTAFYGNFLLLRDIAIKNIWFNAESNVFKSISNDTIVITRGNITEPLLKCSQDKSLKVTSTKSIIAFDMFEH